MTASSSRATRAPDSEVSADSARHSRVKSSTMHKMRKRRPSAKASDTKSRLQRSLRQAAAPSAPAARARACGRLACEPPVSPLDRCDKVSCGSRRSLPVSATGVDADSRTGVGTPPRPASAYEASYHPRAACDNGRPSAPARLTGRLGAASTLSLDRPAHGASPCSGRQKFFVNISLSVALSITCSARSFFSRRFSSSSVFRRFASDTSSPPYFDFHL